jgi:superfamily II DNA/RNA helicase
LIFNEIDATLIDKLKTKGITEALPIQEAVIPKLLAGENCIFSSATGSGKTLAYLLPFLSLSSPPALLLIIAPTYELCSQIKAEIDFFGMPATLAIGSIPMNRIIDRLKTDKPLAIVGNPGRLLDLAKMRKLPLRRLRFLVLDEADRLLAPEMREETEVLLKMLPHQPKERTISPPLAGGAGGGIQWAACSATIDKKIEQEIAHLMQPSLYTILNLSHSDAGKALLPENITHWALFSGDMAGGRRKKIDTLCSFLAAGSLEKKALGKKTLVFCSRADQAEHTLQRLLHKGHKAAGLWGNLPKAERKAALDKFRGSGVGVLVTTDLAARGLDIPDVGFVVAMDVPEKGDTYIHRAGRTGRAGKKGIMLTIGNENEMHRLAAMEKRLGIVVHPKELYGGRIENPE